MKMGMVFATAMLLALAASAQEQILPDTRAKIADFSEDRITTMLCRGDPEAMICFGVDIAKEADRCVALVKSAPQCKINHLRDLKDNMLVADYQLATKAYIDCILEGLLTSTNTTKTEFEACGAKIMDKRKK